VQRSDAGERSTKQLFVGGYREVTNQHLTRHAVRMF
jgi:hypothetical protein